MTWLKIDDKLTSHPKWLPLSLEAKSLWFHAAVWCAAHNNDGHLPPDALPLIAFTASINSASLDDSAAELVRARMWKKRAKSKGDGFEILNWLDYQPSRQQVKERGELDEAKQERKRLHAWLHKKKSGKAVKSIVNRRDGMHCRYCGELTVVTPGDRRSSQRRTYDLLDPASRWDLDAALTQNETETIAEMWVIACGWCNAVKNHRTPEEADMQVLPPHRALVHDLSQSVRNRSGTVPDLGTGLSGSDLSGAGLVGSGRVVSGTLTASSSNPIGFAAAPADYLESIPHPAVTAEQQENDHR